MAIGEEEEEGRRGQDGPSGNQQRSRRAGDQQAPGQASGGELWVERLRAPSAQIAYGVDKERDDAGEKDTPLHVFAEELFQWKSCRTITHAIFDPRTIISHGRPTVLAVASIICLGSEEGRCLVFSHDQKLMTAVALPRPGAVTAIAISADGKRIAAGQADGSLHVIALAHPHKPLHVISPMTEDDLKQEWKETHFQGSVITDLAFVAGRSDLLISRDHQGLAFLWLLTSVLGFSGMDVRCLAGQAPRGTQSAGLRKKALAIAACPLGTRPHSSDSLGVIAVATEKKIFVLQTRPDVMALAQSPFEAQAQNDSPPVKLAWHPAVQTADQDLSDPLLACSRGNHIIISTLSSDAPGAKPTLRQTRHYRLPSDPTAPAIIDSIQFVARDSLLVVVKNHFYVLKISEPAFGTTDPSHHLINLKRYRHDSLRLSASHSLAVRQGSIYCLMESSLEIAVTSTWADTILDLVSRDRITEAIRLAIVYYGKSTGHVFLDLPKQEKARHVVLGNRIRSLIRAALDFTFDPKRLVDGTLAGSLDQGIDPSELFTDLAALSIEAAMLQDGSLESLIQEVYDRYAKSGIASIYLDALANHILKGSIISLPPAIAQALILYYSEAPRLPNLETLICSMKPTTLDIDLALSLSRAHRLEKAEVHVLTRALQDWMTPLARFIIAIRQSADGRDSAHQNAVDGLFQYVAAVWSGHDYPFDRVIPERETEDAQKQVFEFVFSGRFRGTPEYRMPVVFEEDAKTSQSLYPYLRMILSLDPERFLAILDLTFEHSWLDNPTQGADDAVSLKPFTRQGIIEALLEVKAQTSEMGRYCLSANARAFVDIFIARNLPKYPQTISLTPDQIDLLLRSLCFGQSSIRKEDREFATEFVLSVYQPDWTVFERIFRDCGFWTILAERYKRIEEQGSMLEALIESSNDADDQIRAIDQCLPAYSAMTSQQQELTVRVLARVLPQLMAHLNRIGETLAVSVDSQGIFELARLVDDRECVLSLLSHLKQKVTFEPDQMRYYLHLLVQSRPEQVFGTIKEAIASGHDPARLAESLSDDTVIDARLLLVAQESPQKAVKEGIEALKINLLDHAGSPDLAMRINLALSDIVKPDQPITVWTDLLQGLIDSWMYLPRTPASEEPAHSREGFLEQSIHTTVLRSMEHICKSSRPHELAVLLDTIVLSSSTSDVQDQLKRSLITTVKDIQALDLASLTSILDLSAQALLRQTRLVNRLRRRGLALRPRQGQLEALSPADAFRQHQQRYHANASSQGASTLSLASA